MQAQDDSREPEPLAEQPTAEGHYLHEPDGFPHRTMALLAYFLFLVAAFAFAVITRSAVASGVLAILIVPWLIRRIGTRAHAARRREIEGQDIDPVLVPEQRDHAA